MSGMQPLICFWNISFSVPFTAGFNRLNYSLETSEVHHFRWWTPGFPTLTWQSANITGQYPNTMYMDLWKVCIAIYLIIVMIWSSFISWDCNNYGSCKWAEQLHKCRSLAISPANDHSITARLYKCRRWIGMFCGKHGFSYLSSLKTKVHHGCSYTREKITLENTKGAMKKGQSRETNNIKDTRRKEAKQKTHHNMCWTPLCTNKHKSHGTQKVKTHNRTTAKKDEQHGPHQTTRGKLRCLWRVSSSCFL